MVWNMMSQMAHSWPRKINNCGMQLTNAYNRLIVLTTSGSMIQLESCDVVFTSFRIRPILHSSIQHESSDKFINAMAISTPSRSDCLSKDMECCQLAILKTCRRVKCQICDKLHRDSLCSFKHTINLQQQHIQANATTYYDHGVDQTSDRSDQHAKMHTAQYLSTRPITEQCSLNANAI